MYLIAALKSALNYYPTKPWSKCCKDACNACHLFATPYKERQVQRWWNAFKVKNCFPHPRGEEAHTKKTKDVLPPFLRDNEDLHQKFVKHCTNNLGDLSIEMAREWIIEKLIPAAYPLTSEFTMDDRKTLLLQNYQLSETPSKSTVWEWLTRSGFRYEGRKKRFLSIPMKHLQTESIEKNNQPDTYYMNAACIDGSN